MNPASQQQPQSPRPAHSAQSPASPQPPRPNRSRIGRPYRRLRRWARHTPNGTIALNMISAGLALIIIAAIIAIAFL